MCLIAIILLKIKMNKKKTTHPPKQPLIKQMDLLDAQFIEIKIEQSPTKKLSLEQQFPKLKAYQ